MTFAELLQEVKRLSAEEQQIIVQALLRDMAPDESASTKRSLREYRGVGAHLANGEDAQEHVARLRAEWDK